MEQKPSAILIHASAFFAPFLVPIIFILIATDKRIKELAIEGLLFHVIMGICFFVSSILVFVLIGIPLFFIFGIIWIYYPIKGIVKAINEEEFHYPMVWKWVR